MWKSELSMPLCCARESFPQKIVHQIYKPEATSSCENNDGKQDGPGNMEAVSDLSRSDYETIPGCE